MMMYATQCWTWPWEPWLPNFKNLSLKTLSSGLGEIWLLWCRASAQAAWWWSPETSAAHPTLLCKSWYFSSPQLDILDLHEEVKLWLQTSHKDFCFLLSDSLVFGKVCDPCLCAFHMVWDQAYSHSRRDSHVRGKTPCWQTFSEMPFTTTVMIDVLMPSLHFQFSQNRLLGSRFLHGEFISIGHLDKTILDQYA